MNDAETMCERCGEEPATVLVEHVNYGEAICRWCRGNEEQHHLETLERLEDMQWKDENEQDSEG